MKKTLIIAGTVIGGALIALLTLNRANAATIAIIDTAINSNYVKNVTHEVCFTDNESCPNGQGSMDGAGAANVPSSAYKVGDVIHGTEVAQVAIQANPNVKIVFIRIGDWYGSSMLQTGTQLDNAMTWVAQNYKKYGIQAVSISQERENFTGACPVDNTLTNNVETLKSANIPVFAGVGNSGLKNFVGFPACSTDVISVGASSAQGTPYYFSNLGSGVKLMSLGRTTVPVTTDSGTVQTAVVGTSIATPWAATIWVTNGWGTYDSNKAGIAKLPVIMDSYKNKYPFLM